MSPGITLAGKAPWPSHGSLVRLLNYLPKLGYFPPCLITFDYCRVSLWIIFKIKNKANELNLGLGFNMDPVLNYSRNWLKGKFAGNPAFMTGKKIHAFMKMFQIQPTVLQLKASVMTDMSHFGVGFCVFCAPERWE